MRRTYNKCDHHHHHPHYHHCHYRRRKIATNAIQIESNMSIGAASVPVTNLNSDMFLEYMQHRHVDSTFDHCVESSNRRRRMREGATRTSFPSTKTRMAASSENLRRDDCHFTEMEQNNVRNERNRQTMPQYHNYNFSLCTTGEKNLHIRQRSSTTTTLASIICGTLLVAIAVSANTGNDTPKIENLNLHHSSLRSSPLSLSSSTSSSSSSSSSPMLWLRHRQHRQYRHYRSPHAALLYVPNKSRHQYYQSTPSAHIHHRNRHHNQRQAVITTTTTMPTTTTTTTSSTTAPPLSPIYFLQQLVQQQQSWSRHRHYYYYEHDASAPSAASSSQQPLHTQIRNQTYRRWSPVSSLSSRQSGARNLLQQTDRPPKVIYQLNGIESDDQLPLCDTWQVCNKVDNYSTPWIEKQCRCPATARPCSKALTADDGHTIAEKTRLYKTCEPIHKLPTCRYFRDITWMITTTSTKSKHSLNSLLNQASSGDHHHHHHHNHPHHHDHHHHQQQQQQRDSENITRQEMKCVCPPNSVAYIFKHQVYKAPDGQLGYRYHFACSPETKLRCKRKEPCRLFTAKKRPRVEEVTTNTLCQCPARHSCPANHRHPNVLIGTAYLLDNIRTYSGYCYPDNNSPEGDDSSSHSSSSGNDEEISSDAADDNVSRVDLASTEEIDEKANNKHRLESRSRSENGEKRTKLDTNNNNNNNSKMKDTQEEKYLLSDLLRR